MLTIYHNGNCSKSNECLAFVENSNQQFEVVRYLETPLSHHQLEDIIQKLHITPIELVRRNENEWIKNFEGKEMSDQQIIQAMIDFPVLMQRPIAVNGEKAVIARPLDKIKTII